MKTDGPEWREPTDRLSRIADRMFLAMEHDHERTDADMCIVFMDDDKRGVIAIHGYEDTSHAMSHLLAHLQAVFKANNKNLDIMFLDDEGINRVDG